MVNSSHCLGPGSHLVVTRMNYEPLPSMPMFKHQEEAWLKTRDEPVWGLLFEQRCGKSRVLLDTAGWLYSQGKINGLLVIAPKEVCRSAWEQEQVPKFLNTPHEVARWNSSKSKKVVQKLDSICKQGDRLKVLIVNVEAFSGSGGSNVVAFCKRFMKTHRTLLAVDESSTIKERTSKRTDRVLQLASFAYYRRILTGTPITQSPLDAFTQFGFLETKLFGSNWYSFRARYAELGDTYVKLPKRDEPTIIKTVQGYRNLEELSEKMATLSTRVKRSDCFDLPPKMYSKLDVDLTTEARRLYNLMAQKQVLALEAEGIVTPAMAVSRIMSLRQITSEFLMQHDDVTGLDTKLELGNERVKLLLKQVTDLEGQVIIWTAFQHSQQRIPEALREAGIATSVLVGSTVDRPEQLEAFKAGRTRVLVINQGLGQYGLDLSMADWAIYYEHEWSVEKRVQSEDRAQHPQRTKSVGYIDLIVPGTIEETILDAVLSGRKLADLIVDRGWKTLFKEIEV